MRPTMPSVRLLHGTRTGKAVLLAGLLGVMIVGSEERPGAIVAGSIGLFGVNCDQCDGGGIFQQANLGQPVETLIGAKWVAAPNNSNTLYAGGVRAGETVNFHLPLSEVNARLGTTHFLVLFTTVVEGTRPGLLHVRDTSPGAKGNIKMLAQPAAI